MAACSLVTVVAPAHAAQLAAMSAVGPSTATPPAFVPNWDGHTDSTMVSYTVLTTSAVTVALIDQRGRVVDVLERGVRPAGTHLATWDGRTTDGRQLPAGSYRIRIIAKPVAPASDAPGEASLGGVPVVTGTQDVAVALQQPPLSVTGVRLSRGSIGRAKRLAQTRAQFDLSASASVSAVVVDSAGKVVRTLHAGSMAPGPRALAWNGATAGGAYVRDGEYSLLVAAAGSGRPTETLRQPLRVDRTVPALRTRRGVRAASTSRAVAVPVTVDISEAARIQVRMGRKVASVEKPAGTHRLKVSGAALGLRPSKRVRRLRAVVSATDATGNARSTAVIVVVPAATRVATPATPAPQKPTPPPKQPVEHGPVPVNGAMSWPVGAGFLSSGFGPRDGRAHQGIDLAAPTGTPIHAAAGGTINFVGDRGDGYGNLVVVDHPNGVQTWYAHQSRFGAFVVGDAVSRLDVIGYVGSTGRSSGPHLHFEVRIGGKPRNPLAYLPVR